MPKENIYYSCIACITTDSVINKKNHPQVYLEKCKYRIKKTQIPKFIKNELKSDSESEPDSDLESADKELMAKLRKSDIDFDYDSDSNSEKKNFSSNINEIIRPVSNFFFLWEDFTSTKKHFFFINIALKLI